MKYLFAVILVLYGTCIAAPLTIDIPSINLQDAIRLLADYAHQTVILSPEIHGTTTLKITNTEPITILNSLLKTHGLAKSTHGAVWHIAPRAEFIKLDQEESQWRLNREASASLYSQHFKIRYARASDIADIIRGDDANLLSERGTLTVDQRTNQIFIRDTRERLTMLSRLIKRTDIPIQQVLVEARLVSMDQDAERQLGIDFTVREPSTNEAPILPRKDARGNYSIAIAHLPDGSMLDIKLAALEQEGRAELISSPSLFTGSQQEASIEAGEEVPYQEVSESGGTAIAFKKAVLGLKVTPQILPGGKVLLSLKINQDRPAARMVQGMPAISTRQIITHVQVQSGQTLVLGGIYEINHEEREESLPVLGKLPLIGLLFTQQGKRENKRELLVFVTPKIMPQAL